MAYEVPFSKDISDEEWALEMEIKRHFSEMEADGSMSIAFEDIDDHEHADLMTLGSYIVVNLWMSYDPYPVEPIRTAWQQFSRTLTRAQLKAAIVAWITREYETYVKEVDNDFDNQQEKEYEDYLEMRASEFENDRMDALGILH